MRFDGKLKSWNDERGFGFIEPLGGGLDVFVHIKSFPPGTGRPTVGLPLSFEVELGPQGKKRAKSVQFSRSRASRNSPRVETPMRWTVPRLVAIPAFVLVYWFVAQRWYVSSWVAVFYAGASLTAFIFYAVDKSAARHGRWRTPESTLHGLALTCGWPGALLAQQLLRHKATKRSFVAQFWATVVANVTGFVAVHASALGRLVP